MNTIKFNFLLIVIIRYQHKISYNYNKTYHYQKKLQHVNYFDKLLIFKLLNTNKL